MKNFPAAIARAIVIALFLVTAACTPTATIPTTATPVTSLPRFEDYPALEIFTGRPAAVNLASHPDARRFRTRLTEVPEYDTRFAGHYRIVEFGCGTACQSVWAVDLIDGGVFSLFTASSGVAYRPDSRLIVMNDPAFFEEMRETSSVAEVEDYMATYGAPEYWLEEAGTFKRIGPDEVRIDPASRELVGSIGSSADTDDAQEPYCGINGEIRSAGFSPDGRYFVLADVIAGFPLAAAAKIIIAEVATNACVPGGCLSIEGEIDSDNDEDSLLSDLYQRTTGLRQRLKLVSPQAGKRFAPRRVTGELFAFDIGEQTIEVLLRQDNAGDIGERKSSLQLEVRTRDSVRELDSIEHYRDDIAGYRLGELYLSPDGKSIAIIVVMKYEILGHAPSTYCRYMVETATLSNSS